LESGSIFRIRKRVVRSPEPTRAGGVWLLLAASTLLTLAVFELFFRFVIPAAQFPLTEYEPAYGVLHYQIHGRRTGIATFGPKGERPTPWRINNRGWNSSIDYFPAPRHKPLVALIGDSYIEALQVEVGKSVADNLRRLQQGRREVYGFGIGGAPLSQYLQMSRYVREVFHPEVMVFNIVYNDFDESLADLSPKVNFLQLEETGGHLRETPPTPFVPNRLKRLVARSALVRYLVVNLHVLENAQAWTAQRANPGQFYGNVDVKGLERNRDRIVRATDYLVDRIAGENPGTRIVFMMDAPRLEIYEGKGGHGRLAWLYEVMRDACERNGAQFVDLTEPFRRSYERDHAALNFPNDYHWNSVGHEVAAEALAKALNGLSEDVAPGASPP
jgi:hypothetical protein